MDNPAGSSYPPGDSNTDRPYSEASQVALDSPALEAASWSPRARQRLTLAAIIGALAVVYGVALLAEPFRIDALLDILKPMIGVAALGVGGLIVALSYRLLTASGPDQPYVPGDSRQARTWFVWLWLAASVAGSLIQFESIGSLKPGFIAAAAIGLIVMGAAAWWVFRWIGARVDGEWPKLEQPSPVRKRAREWSVFWAFGWGILSTVVAIAVEVLLLQLLGSQVAQLRLPVSVTPLDLAGLANDPGFIVGVFLALAVVAPLIEEGVKALGLWFVRDAIRSHGEGLLLGLSAGLGFGLVESAGNVVNGVGTLFLLVVIWARVAAMLMHSVTTGLVGAGYARARLTGDRRALWSGLLRAVVLHGAWNAIGAVTIIAGLQGDSLLPLVLLIVLIILAVRIVPRVVTASIDRSIQDDHAATDVDLPREWSPMDDGVWWRLAGGRPEYPRRDAPADMS